MKPRSSRPVLDDTVSNLPGMAQSTAEGAKRIFLRFFLVVVALNAIMGLVVIAYDVTESVRVTHQFLAHTADLITSTVTGMRQGSPGSDREVVQRASQLTGVPMALLDHNGQVRYSSRAAISAALPRALEGRPKRGIIFAIKQDLGELSGAWKISDFSSRHDLLVIISRMPEEEGLVEYMTIAAGLFGLALGLSFVIMLVAANWILHRPLTNMVNQLTQALAMDIQRRKVAEQRAVAAKQETEQHLAFRENLIDSSETVGIIATDAGGKIQIFNRAAERILGLHASDVVGKVTLDELHQRCRGAAGGRTVSLHPPTSEEEIWYDSAGEGHLLEIKHNSIRDAKDRDHGVLVTFTDVTDRRRLETELQLSEIKLIQSAKMATLGEMATGIAHELNQPLNNISLLSTRMLRKLQQLPIEPQQRQFFEDKLSKMQGQSERAGKIIDHLRTFGRQRTRQLSPVQLAPSVQGILIFLGEQFRARGIQLEIDLPANLPCVLADEAQLEQVLMNLLINARDALDELGQDARPEGMKISISASRCALDEEKRGVCLTVRDNGPGMSQEVLGRIFEPFFTTKDVGKGTGLGLSISYSLIQEFGGTLEVNSNPGEGTVFLIRLQEAAAGPAEGS